VSLGAQPRDLQFHSTRDQYSWPMAHPRLMKIGGRVRAEARTLQKNEFFRKLLSRAVKD
jgi:hypothetical protein